jgi:hypothetical protein
MRVTTRDNINTRPSRNLQRLIWQGSWITMSGMHMVMLARHHRPSKKKTTRQKISEDDGCSRGALGPNWRVWGNRNKHVYGP